MKTISITESEWAVLDVVWERHPITAREIVEVLSPAQNWKLGTVNTFLKRLKTKNAVLVEKKGSAFLYSPKIDRSDCVRQQGRSFLKRVFRGAPIQALCHFLEDGEFTKDELDRIESLLEKKRSESGKESK